MFGLCLGGNVFGWTIDKERSFAVLDAYAQAGGNFIDTADTYGRRGAGGAGESERIIGRWMAARGNRDQLVIATKVGVAPGCEGLSPNTIRAAADASLDRLGVEHIDLYYAHQDDPETPLQDTLAAFGALLEEGKISYAAASNYNATRLEQALAVGELEGMASYVALQPYYNLMERAAYEDELRGVCERHGLPCLPYFGLARGFLSGKYRPDDPRELDTPRAQAVREKYFDARGRAVLAALDEVAAAHETRPAAVALAWLAAQPTVAAPIASATSVEQLNELLASVQLELSERDLTLLDEASA